MVMFVHVQGVKYKVYQVDCPEIHVERRRAVTIRWKCPVRGREVRKVKMPLFLPAQAHFFYPSEVSKASCGWHTIMDLLWNSGRPWHDCRVAR